MKCLLVVFLICPLLIFGQTSPCPTCNSGYQDFEISSVGKTQKQIKQSFKTSLKYLDKRPSDTRWSGNCAVIDDAFAKAWRKEWLSGTGIGGDNNPSNPDYKDFLVINPNKAEQQTIWSQEFSIDDKQLYNFSFYAANILDPNIANSPTIAIFIDDASEKHKQIKFDYYPYAPAGTASPGHDVSSLDLLPMGTTSNHFPEYITDPNTNKSTGLPWVKIETGPMTFTPYRTVVGGTSNSYIRVTIVLFDAPEFGQDFGIDEICLTNVCTCNELTVSDICPTDPLQFSYFDPAGTTVDKWYINHQDLNFSTPVPQSVTLVPGSTLDNTFHNLTRGTYLITAELSNGSECNGLFRVKGPWPNSNPQLEYEWTSNTQIKLDPWHDGDAVEIWRYTDNTYSSGTQILPDVNGDYLATIDGSSTELYFCKKVDYGCGPPLEACEKICPEPFQYITITHTPTYNSTTGKYSVDFTLSNAATFSNFKWLFGDDQDASSSAPTITHEYDKEGVYTVSVVAERNDCINDAAVLTITLCPPQDNNLVDVIDCVGYLHTFDADDNNNDHPLTNYTWSLNGKILGTGKTQTVGPLNEPGQYLLALQKSDACNTMEPKVAITIHEIPNAGFWHGLDRSNGLQVRLKANNENAASWEWHDVTMGQPGVFLGHGSSYTHTFPSPGTYSIKLKVEQNGCQHESIKTICVQTNPGDCCKNCPQ